MIKNILILISILTIGTITVKGQYDTKTDTIMTKLIGTWYLEGHGSKDSLVFRSISVAPMGWGERIEIHKNGNFVDAYGAKCGNDGKIHINKGKWTFNNIDSTFTTTIPIDYGSNRYKVDLITSDRLILIK